MNKYNLQFQQQAAVSEKGWGRRVVNEHRSPWAFLIEPPEGESPFTEATKVGARAWIGGDHIERLYTLRGEEGAKEYYEMLRPFYDARRYVDVWQSVNEPFVGDATFRRCLTDFTLELDRLMKIDGRVLGGGAFSVGWPLLDADSLHDLLPIFQTCEYVLIHEYSAPTMQDRQSWHCLRYRRYYATLQGMSTAPLARLLVTETGIDGGVAPVYKPKTGWKSYCKDGGWSQYLGQLRWYGEEAAKDDYVEALFPFVCAANSEWSDFDISENQACEVLDLQIDDGRLPLPEDETATDAATLAVKVRWHTEEAVRELEALGIDKDSVPMRRLYSLVRLEGKGLMYRLENALKGC